MFGPSGDNQMQVNKIRMVRFKGYLADSSVRLIGVEAYEAIGSAADPGAGIATAEPRAKSLELVVKV